MHFSEPKSAISLQRYVVPFFYGNLSPCFSHSIYPLYVFKNTPQTPLLLLYVCKCDIAIPNQLQNRFQMQPKYASTLHKYAVPITYADDVWLVFRRDVLLFACFSTNVCAVIEQLLYGTCNTYYSTVIYTFYLSSVFHHKSCVLLIN